MSRWQKTHGELKQAAMELFAEHGYAATSTVQIAECAGVSEMTLFRHFPSKEALLLDDPFDAAMADAVRERPEGETAMQTLTRAIRSSWREVDQEQEEQLRTSLRIVAQTPGLQGAVERNTARTRTALIEALRDRGVDDQPARVAVSAVISGLGAALLTWAEMKDADLAAAIDRALHVLGGW